MILSELEWIVEKTNEDNASLSSSESLTWDHYNERKCRMSETQELPNDPTITSYEVSSIASSPSDEKEESLEDVFQTITPTSPTRTQPTSLPSPVKYVTISC